MAKPEDAVVPILRNIQKKLAEIETRFDRIESKIDHVVDRVDAIEGYLTFTMGETSQNKKDIKKLHAEMKAIAKRLEPLENT